MDVAILSPTASGNALGRAYSLWLVAAHLGASAKVVVPKLETIWEPVRTDHDFCSVITQDEGALFSADVLVAAKPQRGSFDRALRVSRSRRTPLVLDIDDPDFEAQYGERRREQGATLVKEWSRGRNLAPAYRLRWLAREVAVQSFSNPAISRWYGDGIVIPHARKMRDPVREHRDGRALAVCFVGTPRTWKGIGLLRSAIARLSDVSLTVTAPPPPDARLNEHWIGETSLADGLEVVDRCDVVALCSTDSIWGRGQLPAKLVDAMISARLVIASDLPPIRWALRDTGILIPPEDEDALVQALERARSADLRRALGARARARAEELFSVSAVAPQFSKALTLATQRA